MRPIPVNSSPQPFFKGDHRLPVQFALNFGTVEGVAAIVSGPILDVGDQRFWLAQVRKNGADNLEIWLGHASGDVVNGSGFRLFEYESDCAAVIFDEKPIAFLQAVTVDGKPEPDVDRECAEVVFVSNEELEPKGAKPLRYVAIRLRKRQGGLFADGSSVLHFAVLSNRWDWEPVKLIEWHREKAGTIERAHDVLKNELATGVLPSKYFGANAAWLRLAVISYNVLTALKRLALPPDLLPARPKHCDF